MLAWSTLTPARLVHRGSSRRFPCYMAYPIGRGHLLPLSLTRGAVQYPPNMSPREGSSGVVHSDEPAASRDLTGMLKGLKQVKTPSFYSTSMSCDEHCHRLLKTFSACV